MLTVGEETHVPLTLRRPGGDDAYTPSAYTGRSVHVWVHVVLNNISNSFLELKISRLKISRSMVDFEDEKKLLISFFENFYNVNSEL